MADFPVTVRVGLECGHERVFTFHAPRLGEYTTCMRCQRSERVVTHPESNVWSVKCRGCTFGRSFGAARFSALLAADAHTRLHPAHLLYVLHGGRVIERREPQSETLPFQSDEERAPRRVGKTREIETVELPDTLF